METKATRPVVVIYEDDVAREAAVTFCDQLVQRFWSLCGFDISWWSFQLLAEGRASQEAASKAAGAELVIFAARPEGDLPALVDAWIESWLHLRGDREGALVGLMDPCGTLTGGATTKYLRLRTAAHRAGMDYLTQVPQNFTYAIPNSLESYSERAEQVTSVLDEILQRPPPTPNLLAVELKH